MRVFHVAYDPGAAALSDVLGRITLAVTATGAQRSSDPRLRCSLRPAIDAVP